MSDIEPTESAIVFRADGRARVVIPDDGNQGTRVLLGCLRLTGSAASQQWARDAAAFVERHTGAAPLTPKGTP